MSESTTQIQDPQQWPQQVLEYLNEADVPAALLLTIALVANAGVSAYSNWVRLHLKRMNFRKKWTLDQELEAQRVASEIRVLLGADRVVFSYFHNNEVALSGLHFKKLTAYVEAKDPWTGSVLPSVRGIPVTLLLEQIMELLKLKGGWRVTNRDKLPEGGCLKHLRKTGVATQFERIIEHNKIPLILVTVHYFDAQANPLPSDLKRVDVILEQLPTLNHD